MYDNHKSIKAGQTQKCGWIKPINGIPMEPFLLMSRSQADEHWNRCKQTVRFSPTQKKSLNSCLIYLQKQLWVAIMACCTYTCMYTFEWMSDYCLRPKWAIFQLHVPYISWRKQVTFWWDDDDNDVLCVLDQYNELDFYSANSLKQQSGVGMLPLRHSFLIPS